MTFSLKMDAHLDTLVSEQASTIVGQLGLGALYTTLQDFQPSHGPLSSLPGCDALAIQAAVVRTYQIYFIVILLFKL